MDCIRSLAGERNQEGFIPFRAIVEWGRWHDLDKGTINYYNDVIGITEGFVQQWRNLH